MSENLFDHVICGGGSAGSVLAARLSEDPSRRVCLVEAGPDTPPEAVPADIRLSYHGHAVYNPDFLWRGLKVTLPHRPHNRPEPPPKPRSYEQARVMGGGSSINGQLGNRGVPSDYDDWSREGAEGWSWAEVLPFFRKLETDLDFGETPLHGGGGPIPVRRIPREAWPGYSQAAAATWQASGLPYLADQNGDFRDGWFAITTANAAADHRVSAAMGYLTAAVRARPNLTILARHLVLGLDFDESGRAVAVRLRAPDGDTRRLEVRRDIILSMGAIRSPAFLQSQGIGAPEDFSPHGIALRNHRPGVGRNLQEHPTMGMAALLPAASRMPGALTQRNIHAGVRWSSGLPGVAGGRHVRAGDRAPLLARGRRAAGGDPGLGQPQLQPGQRAHPGRRPGPAPGGEPQPAVGCARCGAPDGRAAPHRAVARHARPARGDPLCLSGRVQ